MDFSTESEIPITIANHQGIMKEVLPTIFPKSHGQLHAFWRCSQQYNVFTSWCTWLTAAEPVAAATLNQQQ
jgi:hypothetical protein